MLLNCPGWVWIYNPPASASLSAGIIAVHHYFHSWKWKISIFKGDQMLFFFSKAKKKKKFYFINYKICEQAAMHTSFIQSQKITASCLQDTVSCVLISGTQSWWLVRHWHSWLENLKSKNLKCSEHWFDATTGKFHIIKFCFVNKVLNLLIFETACHVTEAGLELLS